MKSLRKEKKNKVFKKNIDINANSVLFLYRVYFLSKFNRTEY